MNEPTKPVYSELLMELKAVSRQNDQVLQASQKQLMVERQRQLGEIRKAVDMLAMQKSQLELLTRQLEGAAFVFGNQEDDVKELCDRMNAQLEHTIRLLDAARKVLAESESANDDDTLEIPAAEKKTVEIPAAVSKPEQVQTSRVREIGPMPRSRKADQEKVPTGKPSEFTRNSLLGNWICRIRPGQYVCQSFWNDGVFREYEFTDRRITAETEGRYLLENGKLYLNRHRQKSILLKVQAFNDERIDYLMDGQKVTFLYMQEDDLNQMLETAEALEAQNS